MLSARLVYHGLLISVMLPTLIFFSACSVAKPPTANTLPLGSPTLKNIRLEVREGRIYSAASGEEISFDSLIDRLASVRIVYLGETHTSMAHHKIQMKIISGLHQRNPDLKIGMEFFRRGDSAALQDWSAGRLSEEELLRRTGWYAGGGGYNFGYYREIMEFARGRNIPVIGLNIPRSIVHKVAMGGVKSLSVEEKAEVGEVDTSHPEHRELIRFYFSGAAAEGPMKVTPELFENMYAAQSTWDEVMAESVKRAMEGFDGVMVVIAGSGHCSYNLGINRRAAEKLPVRFATVLPIAVEGDGATVVRSLADYFWGIPYDVEPPFYPSLGFSAADRKGKVIVTRLTPKSLAEKSGFRRGDQIIALDGIDIKDLTDLRIRLSAKGWGEKAGFKIKRGDEEIDIIVELTK